MAVLASPAVARADEGGIAAVPFRQTVAGAAEAPDAVLPVLQTAMEEGVRDAIAARVTGSAQTLAAAEDVAIRLARVAYAPDAENRREQARRTISSAYDSYFALDFPAARRSLAEVSGSMERSPQMPDDLAILSDIKLLEGLIAISDSRSPDKSAADESFDLVLRLAPGRTLDPKQFPPYAVAALRAAKQRFDLLPTTQVNVETDPRDAVISLDGVPRGRSPATLDRVPTGEHFYRIEKARMKPLFGRLEFHGGVVEPLRLHLEAAIPSELEGPVIAVESQYAGAPAGALARLLTADRVLAAAVSADGPRNFQVTMWWADAAGHSSAAITRSLAADPVHLFAETSLLAREVLAAPAGAKEPPADGRALARDLSLLAAGSIKGPLKPPPPVWYRKPAVIGGTAGGILLGALIVGAWAVSQPGKVDYNVTVNPN